MKKSPQQRIDAAIASAAKGFTTKVAKKDALDQLSRAYEQVASEGNVSYFDRPSNLCHVRTKHAEDFGRVWGQVEILMELRKEINGMEVQKPTKRVDDTKVREMGARAATKAGISYTDLNGDVRGYCYCCGRVGFKLSPAGTLSRHGYSRPGWGYDVGGCQGSGRTPERTLDVAIDFHERMVAKHEELLATDLVSFALKQGRALARKDRHQLGAWTRAAYARALRSIRAGVEHTSGLQGPGDWRRTLDRQLTAHRQQLAVLEEVRAGI